MTTTSEAQSPRPSTPALFPLGDLVATPGALRLLERYCINPLSLIGRHLQGDWGNVPDEDRAANNLAVTLGNRIISSYAVGQSERVWIISEHDRSSTSIILPSEY